MLYAEFDYILINEIQKLVHDETCIILIFNNLD